MTAAAFLWLARRSLCLPGRLARKFFGSFFGNDGDGGQGLVGGVYRRLSQWIFVC